MKTIISALILMMVMMVTMTSNTQAMASVGSSSETSVKQCVEISGPVAVESTVIESTEGEQGNFFTNNWGALLLGLLSFYDTIARLTPSNKDNSIVSFLSKLFNVIIPNLKKGGGKF